MPDLETDAGVDLLALSNAANLFDLAGRPKKSIGVTPSSIGLGPAAKASHTKVLIVEDEALVALDICDFLSGAGYEVVGLVATEQDAVRKAFELQPDLIIMDLKLKGGGNGFRAIQTIHAGQSIPTLYITAYRNQEVLERLDAQSSNHILFKPFARKFLLEAVETTMRGRTS